MVFIQVLFSLLTETFSLLAFKVMIDTYVFIAVLILTSFPIEVFFLLWLNDFLLCLWSLLFGFCESVICF